MSSELKDRLGFDPYTCPEEAQLRHLVRELFKKLPMTRAFDDDYEATVQLLRDMHNAGRARGAYETAPGERC